MYYITDKRSAIKEIQKYLYVLSDSLYRDIARIPIDGIFDEETKNAVKKFQELMGINITGEVDFETFTFLYEEYEKVYNYRNMQSYIVEQTAFPMGIGAYTEDVRALHVLINELRKTYTELADVGTGNFYTSRTASAVSELRKIFDYTPGEFVDRAFYDRMLEEVDSIRRMDRKYG